MQGRAIVRHVILCLAGMSCLAASASAARQVWTVNGGTTKVYLDKARLAELGLSVYVEHNYSSSEVSGSMEVTAASSLTLQTTIAGVEEYQGGQVQHDGTMVLKADGAEVRLNGFAIRPAHDGSGAELIVVPGRNDGEPAMLRLFDSKVGFDVFEGLLQAEVGRIEIAEDLAILLGKDNLVGESIGEVYMTAESTLIRGSIPRRETIDDFDEDDPFRICSPAVHGPDIIVGTLSDTCNFASQEVSPGVWVDAFSVGTVSCNIGDVICQWVASTPMHPVIAQNMYRLKNGRFEQIGQSWLKHGFTALSGNVCCPCNGGGGSFLDLGCSDPYGCGLNGGQPSAGSKSEVNAYTGVFPYPRLLDPPFSGTIARRLQVLTTDLDPTLNAGAQYFVSGQYVSQDDAQAGNGTNNKSWATVSITGSGTNFTSSSPGPTQREQNALQAWVANDASVQLRYANVPNEGQFLVASKVTDLGNGTWAYEYAIENNNSDRSLGSFTVPMAGGVQVTEIGFHGVPYHSGVPYEWAPWPGVYGANEVSWTVPNASNPNANALRWGNIFNFRFVASVPPHSSEVDVELGLFKPGSPEQVYVSIQVPQQGPPDCDADGMPDLCELDCNGVTFDGVVCANFANCGVSLDCNTDGTPDECQDDCNGNNVPDDCDISAGTSLDTNGNGFPDECAILRVLASAPAGGSGVTWDGAINSLSDAMAQASNSDGLIEEIWVGPGVYRPSTVGATTARAASFTLIDGVAIYGGFAGVEESRDERDPKAVTSVLSGDLNGNDTPDFGGNIDNVYHVVTGSGRGPTAVLDGFTVTGGNAIGAPAGEIYGGGVFVVSGNPTLRNLMISRNKATWGGGMYVTGTTVTPTVVNCRIEGNSATSVGGGLAVVQSSPVFINTVFAGNFAANGGAVFSNLGSPEFRNCTVMANHATSSGGGMRFAGTGTAPMLANSIVWYNTLGAGEATTEVAQLSVASGSPAISYTSVQNWSGNFGGTGNSGLVPAVIELPSHGGDGWGVGNNDTFGNLRLNSASDLIDAGSNAMVPGWVTTDLDELDRIVNDVVDAGAYEFRATTTSGACCNDGVCTEMADGAACQSYVCDVAALLPETFTGCYGDADGNGFVNAADRGFISAAIGLTGNEEVCKYDMDGNGFINAGDRGFVAAVIGLCNGLPDYMDGSGMNGGAPEDRFGTATFTAGATCGEVTCE